jgi:hypothetical protein
MQMKQSRLMIDWVNGGNTLSFFAQPPQAAQLQLWWCILQIKGMSWAI